MSTTEPDGGTPTPTLREFAEQHGNLSYRELRIAEIARAELEAKAKLYPELVEALWAIAERQDDDLPARIARAVLAKVKP